MGQGRLYIVSTPIGNLEDMTVRAARILDEVDCIAAEDTRHTAQLLNNLGVKNQLVSFHEHSRPERARELVDRLLAGEDIALVSSVAGKPKMGYVTKEIIADLEGFLGYNNTHDAILVGVGGLGKAFLGYGGFENYGLNIVAAFDNNERLVNTKINGKPVYDVGKLQSIVARFNIQIGIITVPSYAAQEVADRMVAAGIKAIWNFASVHLNIPSNVALKNEDLASSLALLSLQIQSNRKDD